MEKWQPTEPASLGKDPPEPGSRTGQGAASILPYLINALRTKAHVGVQPEDAEPGVDFPDSKLFDDAPWPKRK